MFGILMSSAEQHRGRDDEPGDNQAGNEVFLFEHFSRSSVAVRAQSLRNGDCADAHNGKPENFIKNL